MARARITATELARTFNAAPQPIYVLDDELTVVFCNAACREWLGRAADGLLGRRCAYHTSPDVTGPDAVAARLCPPPSVLENGPTSLRAMGHPATAAVSCRPDGSNEQTDRESVRRATFIPLGTSPDALIALVVVLEEHDLDPKVAPEPPRAFLPQPQETEAVALHGRVRCFRREAASRYRADSLIGDSPAMRRARAQIELAAGSRASVLLIGPSGSGRQHAAGAVHYGGDPHGSRAVVSLDCSVLGSDLIHSTVTALASARPADDPTQYGTLLLNHADELPEAAQAEAAAVLANRPYPLRLIATAAGPLDAVAGRGVYRRDLAAALSTITIELPPLVHRREDLPPLAQLFLEECNARTTHQVTGFTPEALDALDAYTWPGNVDELIQTVAEAHKTATGPEIGVDDLPERIHAAAQAAAYPRRPEETIVLDEFLARVESELIDRAMTEAGGNKAKAARLLGMTRPRLYRRLVQLGLVGEED